jgi:hypothetical protein
MSTTVLDLSVSLGKSHQHPRKKHVIAKMVWHGEILAQVSVSISIARAPPIYLVRQIWHYVRRCARSEETA